MTGPDQAKWDARWGDAPGPGEPARVLTDFAHLLPTSGQALDLACGLGANALFLAARGLEVRAWDLSPVAIGRLAREAAARGLPVGAEVRDVVASPPEPSSFDVLVVAHFLDRALAPPLAAALRPGGLLYYQTFTRARVDDLGPRDDQYRLGANELLGLFAGLQVLAYREEGRVGDLRQGFRNQAYLVAMRPHLGPVDLPGTP